MKFPKQELNINEYLDKVKSLLSDAECHIFIDTNIISQLYRLNDDARSDFYSWIDSLPHFHIPVWSIHEYSKRVNSEKTRDYLSEISKTKTCHKEISNISEFIKGYVGDSMLQGTDYAGNKNTLFEDIDDVVSRLSKISKAINNNLTNHQKNVHNEITDKLERYSLSSNIFDIIKEVESVQAIRYAGGIPPGYKDSNKESNSAGDLIIWKEILDFCKKNSVKKTIFITRDNKSDIAYYPKSQKFDGRIVNEDEKLAIAHQGLVYEYCTITGTEEVFIINFKILVRLLASLYRELAKSFQIATAAEECDHFDSIEITATDFEDDVTELTQPVKDIDEESSSIGDESDVEAIDVAPPIIRPQPAPLYSGIAIRDNQYNADENKGAADKYITLLKTYNWYKQNPAINELEKENFQSVADTMENRDSFFVLGRNIIQSAEGSSGSAISFVENLSYYLKSYPKFVQKSIVDGCFFEVYFNSNGNLRTYGQYKSTYLNELYDNCDIWAEFDVLEFIRTELQKKERPKLVKIPNTGEIFSFRFEIDANNLTKAVYVNDEDISDTFPSAYFVNVFCKKEYVCSALSAYYAIPQKNITIASEIPNVVTEISQIYKEEELPF